MEKYGTYLSTLRSEFKTMYCVEPRPVTNKKKLQHTQRNYFDRAAENNKTQKGPRCDSLNHKDNHEQFLDAIASLEPGLVTDSLTD